MTKLLGTLLALCALSVASVPAPGAASTAAPIPGDFPLALRISTDDATGDRPVPAPDAPGVPRFRVCGKKAWPLAPTRVDDRLGVRATGPEYLDARELVSVRDAQVAVRAVARIRTIVRACTQPEGGKVWTAHTTDTGYDSVTFTLSYTRGLGLSTYQVIRVGHGVLITQTSDEGSLDNSESAIRRQTRLGRDLAGEMCVFTLAGC